MGKDSLKQCILESRKPTQEKVILFIVNTVYKITVELLNCTLVTGLVFTETSYSETWKTTPKWKLDFKQTMVEVMIYK